MTEAKWLVWADPAPMLEYLRGKASDRKIRLFSAACCRRIWHLLTDERCRNGVEAAERYADGELTEGQIGTARMAAHVAFFAAKDAAYTAEARANFCWTRGYSAAVVRLCGACAVRAALLQKPEMPVDLLNAYERPQVPEDRWRRRGEYRCHDWAAAAIGEDARRVLSPVRPSVISKRASAADSAARSAEENHQASLLRDLFDNPFRLTRPLPQAILGWNGATVRRIAEGIYAERAFERLPILADALLDAGCDEEGLLAHLRSPGPHVLGCWALDVILGKE